MGVERSGRGRVDSPCPHSHVPHPPPTEGLSSFPSPFPQPSLLLLLLSGRMNLLFDISLYILLYSIVILCTQERWMMMALARTSGSDTSSTRQTNADGEMFRF